MCTRESEELFSEPHLSRRPTPTALKLVAGNPGKRAINKREPKPTRRLPACPRHLTKSAKLAWTKLAALLDRMGVITEADGFALERLCSCYAEILECRELITEHGAAYTTTSTAGERTLRANPVVAMLGDADRRFRAYLLEFGLTPAARSKVHRLDGADEPDPLDEFFGD